MAAVLNEQGFEDVTPVYVGSNFECDYEEYNYGRIAKGFLHVWIIPFFLYLLFESVFFVGSMVPLAYLICVTFLYCTVFKKQSDEFFGVLSFTISMIGLFIVVV
jgi:hypothetical protein